MAVLVLGPPLSHLLYPAHLSYVFLPGDSERFTPEPLEGTRYLLTLSAPILLALATVAFARRRPTLPAQMRTPLILLPQVVGIVIVIVAIVNDQKPPWDGEYFTPATFAAAALIACGLLLAARSEAVRDNRRSWIQDSRGWQIGFIVVAAALTALWELPAVNSERSIAWAINFHDAAFHLDETFAVINGLVPHYSFAAQYASLLPYFIGAMLLLFGKTLLIFTITLCAITVLALMAIYGVLRRAAGNATVAFLLFLPFMATSLFNISPDSVIRFTFGVYFPMFPLRYAGPYLLAWLLARHLDRAKQTTWPLFLAAGFVMLNNFEFGVVAVVATVAALVWTLDAWKPRDLLRLAAGVAIGVGGAVALYSLFTLISAGALPRFGRVLEFARLYGAAGYSSTPLAGVIGLPLVIYLTYVAAIGTATVRVLTKASNRVVTGMLAWSGVFGLGSASYYVTRSRSELLPATFSVWALTLALLAIVVLEAAARQPRRLPSPAAFAVLFGLGVSVCSLAQLPWPGPQIARLHRPPAGVRIEVDRSPLTAPVKPSSDPNVRRFVISLADGPSRFVAKPGAPVGIFVTAGHRIADAYGVVDVIPYTGPETVHTEEQVEESLDALRDAGGNTVLVEPDHIETLSRVLRRRGFAILTRSGLRRSWPGGSFAWPGIVVVGGMAKWVDMRHLHPAALD